jgi:SAP domain-containing ribonucleoprotein
MVDYSKKKNDELVALLKERKLPHTGKKADFVKRLEEYDAAQPAAAPAPAAPAATNEDEIDWDDDVPATTAPAQDAVDAGGVGAVKNPVDVPHQTLAGDPAKTDDLTVAATGEARPVQEEQKAEEKVPEKDFTAGITETTIDAEIEKRKARARKFGLDENSDEIKMLLRAKKFGAVEGSNVLGLLNGALPERGDRKRGLDSALEDDGGIRKRGRGRGRGRGGRRDGGRPGPGRRQVSGKPDPKPSGDWMSAEDRAKAEKRKERFAAAT